MAVFVLYFHTPACQNRNKNITKELYIIYTYLKTRMQVIARNKKTRNQIK